mgnify:CR=1 FL=1
MGLRVDSLADLPEQVRQQVGGKIAAQTANKYHNRKIEINGIRFDSRKEAQRYVQLMNAMRLQVDFTIQEAYTDCQGKRIRAIRYRADFAYNLTGLLPFGISAEDRDVWSRYIMSGTETVIEDVKGVKTQAYKLKEKLMAKKGVSIREI